MNGYCFMLSFFFIVSLVYAKISQAYEYYLKHYN